MKIVTDRCITEAVPLGLGAAAACSGLCRDVLRPWTEAMFADELGASDRYWLGLHDEGVLFAAAGTWDAPELTHVQQIVVAPEWRREGLGGALLDATLAAAEARGRTVVTLEVHEQNLAAIRLYTSRGFFEVGARPNYYGEAAALVFTRDATETEGLAC